MALPQNSTFTLLEMHYYWTQDISYFLPQRSLFSAGGFKFSPHICFIHMLDFSKLNHPNKIMLVRTHPLETLPLQQMKTSF